MHLRHNETSRDTIEQVIAIMHLAHCDVEHYETQQAGVQDLCKCCWAHDVTRIQSKAKPSMKIARPVQPVTTPPAKGLASFIAE